MPLASGWASSVVGFTSRVSRSEVQHEGAHPFRSVLLRPRRGRSRPGLHLARGTRVGGRGPAGVQRAAVRPEPRRGDAVPGRQEGARALGHGALADIHRELRDAGVKVYASTGVTDGEGRFGYIVYVRELDFEAAASVLDLEGTVG